MAINSVVRLDKVRSVYPGGGHIYSVEAPETLQNGFVAKLTGLKTGEREIYQIAKPTTSDKLVLIANPAINYDESRMSLNSEQEYSMEVGEIVRAYDLAPQDIFSITKEGLTLIGSDAVVGNYVVADPTTFKLKEVASVTDEKFVAKIVRIDKVGNPVAVGQAGTVGRVLTYVVLEVVNNG